MESAKQAARKENTEASPPNEEGSKTADEEESKAAHGASLTAADDAKTIRQKKSPHAKDMEALKISVKMKIFS